MGARVSERVGLPDLLSVPTILMTMTDHTAASGGSDTSMPGTTPPPAHRPARPGVPTEAEALAAYTSDGTPGNVDVVGLRERLD